MCIRDRAYSTRGFSSLLRNEKGYVCEWHGDNPLDLKSSIVSFNSLLSFDYESDARFLARPDPDAATVLGRLLRSPSMNTASRIGASRIAKLSDLLGAKKSSDDPSIDIINHIRAQSPTIAAQTVTEAATKALRLESVVIPQFLLLTAALIRHETTDDYISEFFLHHIKSGLQAEMAGSLLWCASLRCDQSMIQSMLRLIREATPLTYHAGRALQFLISPDHLVSMPTPGNELAFWTAQVSKASTGETQWSHSLRRSVFWEKRLIAILQGEPQTRKDEVQFINQAKSPLRNHDKSPPRSGSQPPSAPPTTDGSTTTSSIFLSADAAPRPVGLASFKKGDRVLIVYHSNRGRTTSPFRSRRASAPISRPKLNTREAMVLDSNKSRIRCVAKSGGTFVLRSRDIVSIAPAGASEMPRTI